MNTTEAIHVAELNDAELVAESLDGNRDAFRQIVERYQTLISSLAYCATGNVSQSEDLAQETFVSAWTQLAQLRESAKLRPWLCRITRFLISKHIRRQGREPEYAAESLEAVDEWVSPEPLPPDQVISEEEKAILWRSIERIPQIYREPLVLFYREQQSIETVAHDLDLTEDAAKQRLSRGRKLLQEQFLAFVAGALKQTTPGKTFTIGVMAVLPMLATTAKAATASAAAAKGGAMAKATGVGIFFQTILKVVSGILGVLSPFLLLGGYFGFKMDGDARHSAQRRQSVTLFWRIMVGCLAAFVALPIVFLIALNLLRSDFSGNFRQSVLDGITVWLGLMYAVVPAALLLWAWQRRRHFQPQATSEPEPVTDTRKKKRLVLWVVTAMIATACVLGFGLLDTNWEVQHVTTVEVQKMVADGRSKEAEFSFMQNQNGYGYLWIALQENGTQTKIIAPADDATLALLKEKGIKCPTYVQGRDFEVFGWPARLLPIFCIFILAIGGVVLLRKPGKFSPQQMDGQQTRKMQRIERVANKVFGTGLALVLIAATVLLCLMTRWRNCNISSSEAQQILSTSGNVRCEIYQFSNGTKEMWFNLNKIRRYPSFIAPADASTLALLAEKGIVCRTLIQGRDFGHADPKPRVSLICIFILMASAIVVIRWMVKQNDAPADPAAP